ncbi:YpjP-like protein [Halobacillus karajensis]|uniref:YpjP-like protein n=1 Tax=Halobacillus karajensis TaxID=195088 RepID=A0A059NW77_9BACI|nr:YpjP family protein [Halobacillus karajensis]CDQ19294.1 hypothetical protein BN982_01581 [Halobacillus karajensis]CDQ22543.1 hypothetical protein BN983_00756 [Halobacillus karajensis]CDQ26025.1 hypothetical protein BN981_00236 [Halobacillus karajensis]SEH38739.1 YpjP-like protein [Halobacillus karajensis]
MKPLMRKIFVVLISVMTLGLYIPPMQIDTEAADKKGLSADRHIDESALLANAEELKVEEFNIIPDLPEEPLTTNEMIETMTEQAKTQTLAKMGPRIIEKVDEDMAQTILPKIEEVMEEILTSVDTEEVPYYEITEEPTQGYGERIFNIYNKHTEEEVARFHVRRDKRPGEGYWFNFHYHLQEDNFMKHREIGEIYWEKNTPPKWMS